MAMLQRKIEWEAEVEPPLLIDPRSGAPSPAGELQARLRQTQFELQHPGMTRDQLRRMVSTSLSASVALWLSLIMTTHLAVLLIA